MWAIRIIVTLVMTAGTATGGGAEEALGIRPLLTMARQDLSRILPGDCQILIEPRAIEQFLDGLDGTPPDWAQVYGRGHHDPDHDERLFTLNRERDAKRAGNPGVRQLIAFVWSGELSRYDADAGGFHVALGPEFTPTRWGVIRFKYEDLHGDLVAKTSEGLRSELEGRIARSEVIEITVAMTGRLIPDESLVYDFSHDHEGLGVIMPVVRVERIDYLLTR